MSAYRLVRPDAAVAVPVLDEQQRAVVEHRDGPLLVLAGPGTGKTTTLVEAVVARIEEGVSPDAILALTFSRKAAEQLRDRVTARLGRTLSTSLSSTFHSFAYGLVRTYDRPGDPDGGSRPPLRLLSAPEQEVLLTDLLTAREARVAWPASLARATGTRGFARELASLVARTTERGIGFERLARLGADVGRDDLVAAAAFMEQYDDVLHARNLIDYSGLIATAVGMLQDPEHPARADLRARFAHVYVDEYQDTDPSQVAMLQAVAGDGRDLVVVGDPHQSIYGFRGAEVRGILDFPHEFRGRDGAAARVLALGTTRRFGPAVLRSAQSVASRLALTGAIPAEASEPFRHPQVADVEAPGRVEALTFDHARAEAEHLADLLRRAHLQDDVAWGDMAVLVRSGRTTIPSLRRALVAAGVPVEVSADETPLSREPAVLPLLDALHAVADPDWLDAERAEALLLSPLVGLHATDLRALGRALRLAERARGDAVRPSGELLRASVLDPALLGGLDSPVAGRVVAFAALLTRARERMTAGGTLDDVLWTLWEGTAWPQRLREQVDVGGGAARLAHRDLDAMCALFDYTARAEEHVGQRGVVDFLAELRAQQIPADTLAERGVRGDAVRLLTAHRSKGLEWRLVVVAHVQEEGWPDLRRRTSLLRADEVGRDGPLPPPTARELLAEERRLFYVACTRARERLVVSAVASTQDDGEQASRFLDELDVEVVHVPGRPPRPLSMAGLVAELRRTCADESRPEPLRRAAARRLAQLARERQGARRLVTGADPGTWWGTRAWSLADRPLRPDDRPVTVTASLLAAVASCPARWFLEREAGGQQTNNQGQGFGNVVHALADRMGRGELPAELARVDEVMAHVDRVWPEIPFRTPWSAGRERDAARTALVRLVTYLSRPDARALVGSEEDFETEVPLPDGTSVVVRGRADRIELDADGRVVVVDLKTTKYPPPEGDIPTDPQLGLYQLAVEHGGFAHLPAAAEAPPGGAELWQLRKGYADPTKLRVQRQDPLPPAEGDEPRPVEQQVLDTVALLRAESFPTKPEKSQCDRCDFQTMCPAWNAQGVVS